MSKNSMQIAGKTVTVWKQLGRWSALVNHRPYSIKSAIDMDSAVAAITAMIERQKA
jgi:hypothetical protein